MVHTETAREPIPSAPWKTLANGAGPELDRIAREQGYHSLDIEDCRHDREIGKVVERSGYTFIVAKVATYKSDALELQFHDLDLFVKPGSLLSVEEHASDIVERVCARYAVADAQSPADASHLVYALLDEIVDEYLSLVDDIGESVEELEDLIWKDSSPETVQRIFKLKRALIEFRRNAGAMREVVSALIRHPHVQMQSDLESYYRDLYEHTIRVIEFIETYHDVLNGIFDIHLSTVTNRTNDVVKILTVYGIIALPLLVIPGLYGMNIPLPFERSPHAFFIVAFIIVVLTVALLIFLKRRKWF